MAVAIDADQDQHVACSLRQRGDRSLDIERRRARSRVGNIRQSCRGFGNFVPEAQAATPRKDGMDRDSLQPSRKATAMLEAIQRPPRSDERLLGTIFGRLALTGEPQTQSEHTGCE